MDEDVQAAEVGHHRVHQGASTARIGLVAADGQCPHTEGLPTAREVAREWLAQTVALNTRFDDQRGCLFLNGALAGSDDAEPVRQLLVEVRAQGEERLRSRFQQARAEGDLPAGADPAVLAAWLMATAHGIAVQAKAGFSAQKLQAVADQALSGWPVGN